MGHENRSLRANSPSRRRRNARRLSSEVSGSLVDSTSRVSTLRRCFVSRAHGHARHERRERGHVAMAATSAAAMAAFGPPPSKNRSPRM